MAAISQELNFADVRRQALSVRNTRLNISNRNGGTILGGGNIQIVLPQQSNSFLDIQNSFLMFKIGAVSHACYLDGSAYSLFSRMTARCSGAVLSDLTNMDAYYATLLTLGLQPAHVSQRGAACWKTGGKPNSSSFGARIDTGTKDRQTAALPFMHGLFTSEKMIGLDVSDPIVLEWYVNPVFQSCIRAVAGVVNDPTDIQLTDIYFVANVCEVSPTTQALIDQSVGDQGYNLVFDDVVSTSAVVPTGSTSFNFPMSARYSSLSKVLCIARASSNANVITQLSVSNRSAMRLSQVSFTMGGLKVPNQPILIDTQIPTGSFALSSNCGNNVAEVMSQLLIGYGTLSHAHAESTINSFGFNAVGGSGVNGLNFCCDVGTLIAAQQGADIVAVGSAVTPTGVAPTFASNTNSKDGVGTFAWGYCFEGYLNSQLISGINSLGMSTFATGSMVATLESFDITCYSTFQAMLSISPLTRSYVISV